MNLNPKTCSLPTTATACMVDLATFFFLYLETFQSTPYLNLCLAMYVLKPFNSFKTTANSYSLWTEFNFLVKKILTDIPLNLLVPSLIHFSCTTVRIRHKCSYACSWFHPSNWQCLLIRYAWNFCGRDQAFGSHNLL